MVKKPSEKIYCGDLFLRTYFEPFEGLLTLRLWWSYALARPLCLTSFDLLWRGKKNGSTIESILRGTKKRIDDFIIQSWNFSQCHCQDDFQGLFNVINIILFKSRQRLLLQDFYFLHNSTCTSLKFSLKCGDLCRY